MAEKETKKKVGRPKKTSDMVELVDEKSETRLDMSDNSQKTITIEEMNRRWKETFSKIENLDSYIVGRENKKGISTTVAKWNSLNPFLQNQRLKSLYTLPGTYSKGELNKFLSAPANYEPQLRASGWANSSSQQIYYNMLRRACDIPQYKYFVIPEMLNKEGDYSKDDFITESRLVDEWLDVLGVQSLCKTMSLQIKREGKQSYLLRNKWEGEGKNKRVGFCTLQKMPTDWVKITGIGQLGYTISFNMMYFLNPANNPANFGEFMIAAWNDLTETGVFSKNDEGVMELDLEKARSYKFTYEGQTFDSIVEKSGLSKRIASYMLWLKMPYDICYTFGSDNSHPWVAPDTMGLLTKLQELTDYGTLAGLIASTPLTAILTGEAEFEEHARAGKTATLVSPEVLQGLQDLFNATTSTNVEAMFFPLKNIKLQQLNADVNSSEIISTATENFVEVAGESGLTITNSKPNVSQIKTAQLLAASQQRYVTLQFENVLNFILQHKLGFKYSWKIRLWGDVFSFENEKKYIKELVMGGATFLLPKLASAEDISLRDTKAMASYIKSLDFYKDFQTLTMLKQDELSDNVSSEIGEAKVGRPSLDDADVENDSTAKSKEDGTNTSDNRDTLSAKCPLCGAELEEGQEICEDCLERLIEDQEEK